MPRGGNREGAGRKGGWRNSETQVIRVPKILAAHILEYARKIDSGELERLSFAKTLDIFSTGSRVDDSVTESKIGSNDSVTESLSLILESVTESLDFVLESVTESKTPPSKPDGKRWISSEQAWNVAQKRGCDRNLNGFRNWSKRHPDKCLECFSLRRLESIQGRTCAPAFEDLRYNDGLDCQDFN